MMSAFDAKAIVKQGWRQGSVLGPKLWQVAREHAPQHLASTLAKDDWLVVVSHDCDCVNPSLDKEPAIELIRAVPLRNTKADKLQVGHRNPRLLQLEATTLENEAIVLQMNVHERWMVPRSLFAAEPPRELLLASRIVVEWLAKRYIRAAFPSAFDARWHARMRDWGKLLARHSDSIAGVYLRLDTLDELEDTIPYQVALIVAVPAEKGAESWGQLKDTLENEVSEFWTRFEPSICCREVDVYLTSELTLFELERYQRFDADYLSFGDDSETTPLLPGLSSSL